MIGVNRLENKNKRRALLFKYGEKMGCNTSKESVQPAAEDAKDDVKNGGEVTHTYFALCDVAFARLSPFFHDSNYPLKAGGQVANSTSSIAPRIV